MAASPTSWATLKYDPTEPSSAKGYQPQHSTVVKLLDRDHEEVRIYFNPGLYSYLQAGDTVLCSYKKGKWRLDTSPPELTAELQKRMETTPQPNTAIATYDPIPSTPTPQPQRPSRKALQEMSDSARCYVPLLLQIHCDLITQATTDAGEVGITASQLENYAIAIFNKVAK